MKHIWILNLIVGVIIITLLIGINTTMHRVETSQKCYTNFDDTNIRKDLNDIIKGLAFQADEIHESKCYLCQMSTEYDEFCSLDCK